MMSILANMAAVALAVVIVCRVVCVVYQTTHRKHAHPMLFIGFGYSYVILGSGAITAALAIVTDHHDMADVALWLLLAGSCGLIAFDRRAARCWSVSDCPIERHKDKDLC